MAFKSSSASSDGDSTTLADVADAAGVSKTTASYVMNDRPGISPATRERVLAAAAELGYQAPRGGRAGQGQPRGPVQQIGAVLSATSSAPAEGPNYYVTELLSGVEAETRKRSYGLQVAVWAGELPEMVARGEVAGVLFLGGSFPADKLLELTLPVVLVGTTFPRWPHDSVLADNRRGAYLAVQHLLSRGRTRVAFVNGPPTTSTSAMKLLGYHDALADAGIEPDEALVAEGDFSPASGQAAVAALLDRDPAVDAIFVADDPMAVGVLHALEERGRSVPGDVAVIGYGDSPTGSVTRPALSTVRVFQRQLGTMGARRLLNRLDEEGDPPVQMLISPELVLRETA